MPTTPGGQAVEPVDEVHGVGHERHPDHRQERRQVGREHDEPGEGDPEEEQRDPEERQEAAGEDLPGQLGRRGDLPEVVERPDGEHHGGPDQQPERLRGATEHRPELRQYRGGGKGGQEPPVHGSPTQGRGRPLVDPPGVRRHDRAEADRHPPNDRREQPGDEGRHQQDDEVLRHASRSGSRVRRDQPRHWPPSASSGPPNGRRGRVLRRRSEARLRPRSSPNWPASTGREKRYPWP